MDWEHLPMTANFGTDGTPDMQSMFAARAATGTVGQSGNTLADGVLSGYAWDSSSITYAFPDQKGDYGYRGERDKGFSEVNGNVKDAVRWTLDQGYGNAANDGFSVEGLTLLSISAGSDGDADIRYAESRAANPTAYAYYPVRGEIAGDVWLGTSAILNNPRPGHYAFATIIHETGHALGLKHGHASDRFDLIRDTLPGRYDSLEYSVMTYHSHVDQKGSSGYTNEMFGFPQSFMMADILALQHMYGADYTTNGGDTVYRWTPKSGNTLVDGAVGINAGANRIFATIWDGGGSDTYDLSAYRNGVEIDLRAGQASTFSTNQLADLDQFRNGKLASGNIYNALLHEGDQRSLIENAIGGRGNDTFRGNAVDNVFTGNAGADIFFFRTGGGSDTIADFSGNDRINLAGMGLDFADVQALGADSGGHYVIDFGNGDTLTLLNVTEASLTAGDFMFG
jgi:serralysin